MYPNIRYIDADGVERILAEHRGKVVFIYWWASWCGPCKRKMPEFQKLYDQLKDERGIVWIFMGILENYEASRGYAKSQGYTIPVAQSIYAGVSTVPTADGGTFGVKSIPQFWVIDQNGVIITRESVNSFSAYRFRNLLRRGFRLGGR